MLKITLFYPKQAMSNGFLICKSLFLLLFFSSQLLIAQNRDFTLKLTYHENRKIEKPFSEEEKNNVIRTFGGEECARELVGLHNASHIVFEHYIHKDSSLSLNFLDGHLIGSVSVGFDGINWLVDLRTGEWQYFTEAQTKKTVNDFYKDRNLIPPPTGEVKTKKLKKQEVINGFNCDVWEEYLTAFDSETTYWTASTDQINHPLPKSRLVYKDQLVIRSVTNSVILGRAREEEHILIKIDTIYDFNIMSEVNRLMREKKGMYLSYADLEQNKTLPKRQTKELQVENIYFKGIEAGQVLNLKDLVGDSEFLLVDIWASWCGPCVRAFPELQKLKQEYQGNLQVLSLNHGDTQIEKVQAVLQKQAPTWPQAFASHQVHHLLSPVPAYPVMVVFDRTGKVVMQGDPSLEFTKIRNFLDEQLQAAGRK
jgi:thiol-disulfide isomerase/thioredoxin